LNFFSSSGKEKQQPFLFSEMQIHLDSCIRHRRAFRAFLGVKFLFYTM